MFLLPIIAPMTTVSAQLQFRADDFGILSKLDEVLNEREARIDDILVITEANQALDRVRLEVRESDSGDPLARLDSALAGVTMQPTAAPPVMHPAPYDMMLNPDNHPEEWAGNMWGTLLTVDNFIVWVHYRSRAEPPVEYDAYEEIDYAESSFILGLLGLASGNDPLLHEVDVDGDGNPDVRVGLTVAVDEQDGWGLEGNPPTVLWAEPAIEFTVVAIDPSDSLWPALELLEVTLMKQFAYSLTPLSQGESYVWVIDSRFTMTPEDFSFEVGLERLWFDIAGAGASFLAAIIGGLPVFGNPDESDIRIAAIAAPYAIHIDNVGQTDCPAHYDPETEHDLPSHLHPCTVAVGFGYIHFQEPDNAGDRPIEEIAYIDLAIHPVEGSVVLPEVIDIVLRNDKLLTTGMGIDGEGGLDTIEYYADERCDLHLHFHEDRSNQSESPGGPYGNITDSLGWLRGMPSGTLSEEEIRRVFRLVGSESSSVLPGQMPTRLSAILAIKNFTRDQSPNADDDTLPVNPSEAPNTLIVFRATESITEIDYVSWFMRSGAPEDHRRLRIHGQDLPTALVLYGTFELSGGSDAAEVFEGDQGDPLSALLDATILNLVDVFLDVGAIVNSIPESIVGIIGGDGSGTGTGGELHIVMFDDISASRQPMAVGRLRLELGSGAHPVGTGPHIVMSTDLNLTYVEGRHGQMDPLVPVAISIEHHGLIAVHVIDDEAADSQQFSLQTLGGDPLKLLYIEHRGGALADAGFQMIEISEQPASLDLLIEDTSATWRADRPISEILYAGRNGTQRQAVLLKGLPANFSMSISGDFSWVGEQPLTSVSVQMGNASNPRTMDGDHFLFWQDVDTAEASLSARLTGLSEVGWAAPVIPGAEGRDGMPTATLVTSGTQSLLLALRDETEWDDPTKGVNGDILIEPLPAVLELAIPSDEDSESGLVIPNFSTESGLAGLGFFLGGFSDLGQSINDMLGGIATSISGGDDDVDHFSAGVTFNANAPFSLTLDVSQGSMQLDEPSWVHGLSMSAGEVDNRTAFHLRAWLPDLPPVVSIFVSYENQTVRDVWDFEVDLEQWVPRRSEFIFDIHGLEGRDVEVIALGLTPGTATDLHMVTQLEIETGQTIPTTTIVSRYNMSHRLDSVYAMMLDRNSGTRSEVLLTDIPRIVDVNAALGRRVTLSLSVPEDQQRDGMGVGSVFMQQLVHSEGEWWPLTVFINDVPGVMELDVEPSSRFDITQDLSFQGMPTLTYSSSGDGMDLFISGAGRAINSRGDMLLLAENLASHATIQPTDDFGLSISSSGDGVGRLYVRQTNVPVTPGVWMQQMEAVGENLQSATVKVHTIAGLYPVIEVGDVRGGRIAATASLQVDAFGTTLEARGVLIDAQTTSYIPSASTLGVNGLTGDLSLLNAVPGFEGSSTHWLFAEPLSSAVLTVLATIT